MYFFTQDNARGETKGQSVDNRTVSQLTGNTPGSDEDGY